MKKAISIFAVIILLISTVLTGCSSDNDEQVVSKYDTAIEITDSETFKKALETDAEYVFVYGDLKAVDTVSFPDVDGEYMYIKKEIEVKDSSFYPVYNGYGFSYVPSSDWDTVEVEELVCKEIEFCGVVFDSSLFSLSGGEYIMTVYADGDMRYSYYGYKTEYSGTMFASIKNNTITEDSEFYRDTSIEELKDSLNTSIWKTGKT